MEDYIEFFKKITDGEPKGSTDVRLLTNKLQEYRWFHGDFTLVKDKKGAPIHAIISFYDITDQRERELAYKLWQQSTFNLPISKCIIFEHNLTRDVPESSSGELRSSEYDPPCKNFNERTLYWAHKIVHHEDADKYIKFLNLERLLGAFYSGTVEESLEFRTYADSSYNCRWEKVTVKMAEYPDTRDVKAFLIYEDIDEKKIKELILKEQSETDSLTGALNRKTFNLRVDMVLKEFPEANHAVFMIDIDNFKTINDSLGHFAGDRFLLEIASRIKAILRDGDLIGRIGGDEFIIFIKNISYLDSIKKRAEFICSLLKIKLSDTVYSSGSVGVALYPLHGNSFETLYKNADIALYKAKELGKNRYEFYNDSLPDPKSTFYSSDLSDSVISTSDIDSLDFAVSITTSDIMQTNDIYKAQLEYIFQMSAVEAYEIDISARRLIVSAGTLAKYAIPTQIIENVPQSMIENGVVHEDSAATFTAFYDGIYQGNPIGNCIVKTKRPNGQYALTRLSYRCIFNKNGTAVKAVGVSEQLENIADSRFRFEQEEKLHLLITNDLIYYGNFNLVSDIWEDDFVSSKLRSYKTYSECFYDILQHMANAEEYTTFSEKFSPQAIKKQYDSGDDWSYYEFRLTLEDGLMYWVAISLQMLISPYNGNLHGFFYIRNVDNRKKNELALNEKAHFDLSGTFYLRSTFKALVINSGAVGKSADCLCGIAVFKIVNYDDIVSRFGSSAISTILLAINRKIRFSSENRLITSIYGDGEIFMFLSGIESEEWFKGTLKNILFMLYNPAFFITTSEQYLVYKAGGYVFKSGTSDFEQLYRAALFALEKANITEPYVYTYKHSSSLDSYVNLAPPMLLDIGNSLISLAAEDKAYTSLIGIIQLLLPSQSERSDIIFSEILRLLGEFYRAHRAYILEIDETLSTIDNTYEWCSEGIEPQLQNLKNIPLDASPLFLDAYKTHRSLSIKNISALDHDSEEYKLLSSQSIYSLYVVPYVSNNTVTGFIGIDNPSLHTDDMLMLNMVTYFTMGEIQRRKDLKNKIYLSRHDILSGTLSRNSFFQDIRLTNFDTVSSVGVLFSDIVGLQSLNDKFGDEYGDSVIKSVSSILTAIFPPDTVYRIEGSTFLTVIKDISNKSFIECVEAVKAKFSEHTSYYVALGNVWSQSFESVDKLINEARELMVFSKRNISGKLMAKKSAHRKKMAQDLVSNIDSGSFVIYLQPKADTENMCIMGAEALVRYIDRKGNMVSPHKFIPLLEDTGLIYHIDFFVFEEVLKLLERWKNEGRALFPVSLNFSRSTMLIPNVIEKMLCIADKYDVPKNLVEIEITERLGAVEWDTIKEIGNSIPYAGFRLSLDDFGAKYSNLAILSSIKFSALKIDKSIVNHVISSDMTQALIKNMASLCSDFGIDMIAEGVETSEQFNKLKQLGCPFAQGYYTNKPLSIEDFENHYNTKQGAEA